MVIDCHTHAFADKIAAKAVAQLVEYYHVPVPRGARLTDLLQAEQAARVDAFILLVAATKPDQVRPANDWLLSLASLSPAQLSERTGLVNPPMPVPFGAFHPENPHWRAEIQRLRQAGIKGIKLHPEFQGVDLADPALAPCFAEIEKDFIVLIHIGDETARESNRSTPRKVAAIAEQFPKLRLIAAHMGGYRFWHEALELLAGRDLYLDTSSARRFMEPSLFRQLVAKHGVERILFGSDYPVWSPLEERDALGAITWLGDHEKALIMGGNCARLLGG
jgi:uncharacterized protein